MNDVPDTDPTATPKGTGPTAATGTSTGTATSTGAGAEGEQVMDLLAEHVPLALLVDLITPEGPASADILRTEGMPDDAWWEPDADAPADDAPPSIGGAEAGA